MILLKNFLVERSKSDLPKYEWLVFNMDLRFKNKVLNPFLFASF